ncbi:MAG: hypothetical protein ABI196_09325, partial [Bradyrhizobium sp.]
ILELKGSPFASNRESHPGSRFAREINEMLQPWEGSLLEAISQLGGLELLPVYQVTGKRSVHQDVDGLHRATRQNHE